MPPMVPSQQPGGRDEERGGGRQHGLARVGGLPSLVPVGEEDELIHHEWTQPDHGHDADERGAKHHEVDRSGTGLPHGGTIVDAPRHGKQARPPSGRARSGAG